MNLRFWEVSFVFLAVSMVVISSGAAILILRSMHDRTSKVIAGLSLVPFFCAAPVPLIFGLIQPSTLRGSLSSLIVLDVCWLVALVLVSRFLVHFLGLSNGKPKGS